MVHLPTLVQLRKTKKDQSLRACLDLQKLNKALKRFPPKILAIEEITTSFTKAKVFTTLGAKAGYWACKVAPESQELLTFRGPTGRKYRRPRLPFGLNVSQDLYQKGINRITEQCTGCISISDDILIFRDTEEHDCRLTELLRRDVPDLTLLNASANQTG